MKFGIFSVAVSNKFRRHPAPDGAGISDADGTGGHAATVLSPFVDRGHSDALKDTRIR